MEHTPADDGQLPNRQGSNQQGSNHQGSNQQGSSGPAPGQILRPLSIDRIKAALEAQGWAYNVDTDGDVGGRWPYGSYYFFVNGSKNELLCVRGSWRAHLDLSDLAIGLEVANDWNRERFWPKVSVVRDDDGTLLFAAEHNVDYEHGLSDEQLIQHLICAIHTSETFFEHLSERFPDAWAEASARF